MNKNKLSKYQNKVLQSLSGKIDDFYLVGGTALSLFYFQHRVSEDLDFFTRDFSNLRIKEVVLCLEKALGVKIKLVAQSLSKNKAKIMIYNISFAAGENLKIDFVEDTVALIKKPKLVEGVKISSLEDIYLRKIYTVCGMVRIDDKVGREKFIGGRQDAKDSYDLYFLSHTFMSLVKFVNIYGNTMIKEGLIGWFHAYGRIKMMQGLLSLNTNKQVDCKMIERHFQDQIGKIIEEQIGKL